jgi:hypothetical protein
MRTGAAVISVALVASLARGALASPDPFSPASTPPPPAFSGGSMQPPVKSSFVPRSEGLRVLGIVLVVAGGLTLIAAPIVGASSTSPAGDPTASSSTDGPVLGLFLGGLGLVAAGIPIAVYGSTPVAPPASPKAMRIEPTGSGLRFVF